MNTMKQVVDTDTKVCKSKWEVKYFLFESVLRGVTFETCLGSNAPEIFRMKQLLTPCYVGGTDNLFAVDVSIHPGLVSLSLAFVLGN